MKSQNIILNGYDDYKDRKYSSKVVINETEGTSLSIREFIRPVKNIKWKIRIFCGICSREYTTDIYQFMEGTQRCCLSQNNKTNALRKKFAYTPEKIREMSIDLTDGEYKCLNADEYVNKEIKLKFKHHLCDEISIMAWTKFQGGQRCAKCSRVGGSIPENNFEDILRHFNIKYERQKKYQDCRNDKTGMLLPYDFYIYELKALVEIDGPQHRRPSYGEEAFKKQKYRDKIKDKYAKNKNIRLIRVEHDSWSDEVFESLINIVNEVLGKKIMLCDVEDNIFSTTMEIQKARVTKARDGEYIITDNLFKGVDSYYNVLHTTCGTEFSIIYDKLRSGVQSCPICNERVRKKKNFKKLVNSIKTRFLNYKVIERIKSGRVLMGCTHCNISYKVHMSNFNKGEGGCPKCRENRPEKSWLYKLNSIGNHTLSKTQKIWINNQHARYRAGSLTKWELSHIKNNKYAYNLICKGVKILRSNKEHT